MKTEIKKVEVKNPFTQLCVMQGLDLDGMSGEDLENELTKTFKCKFKFAESTETLPDLDSGGFKVSGTGGRTDVFFYVHSDDIGKFSIARFQMGIRWWEDVLLNGNGHLYTSEFLTKYPTTW